jgi:glycoside/pentoside/hexuronide:cation symporter, GPH family
MGTVEGMEQNSTPVAPPIVPGLGKFLYSFGNIGVGVVDRVVATWLMYYYLPPEGSVGFVQLIPTQMFGLIFFVGRALDTLFDPSVAFYSDRCRSRLGRRTPFMLFGGLPLAAAFVFLFFPPVHGVSSVNSIYLCVMLSTFFFFFSFYVCPYLGLLPELARTQQDRINLTSMQGVFLLLGTIVGMVVAPIIIAKYGYRSMALIMGGLALVSFYAPITGVNEKKYCKAEPSSLDLVSTIRETLKNKPFVIYLFGNLTFWFGFNIISTCVPYYVTALLKQPVGKTTIFFGLALGLTLLFIPVINLLTRKTTKRNIMIMSLSMFMVLLPMIYFFGDPRIPIAPVWFGYIIIALLGLPLATLFIVPNALVADLTDYDAKLTGLRREAIYFGTQGLFLKIDLGLSQVLMTTLFSRFGYSLEHPLGIRLTGIVGGFFALTGLIAFLFFPRDLNAHAELEIKRRAGKA